MQTQTKTQRLWQEAEACFPPDHKIQVHSYGSEIWLDVVKRQSSLSFELSPDEARQLAEALIRAAERVDASGTEARQER